MSGDGERRLRKFVGAAVLWPKWEFNAYCKKHIKILCVFRQEIHFLSLLLLLLLHPKIIRQRDRIKQ